MSDQSKTTDRSAFRRILSDLGRERGWILLSFVLAAVTVILTLYIPVLIGRAVDVFADMAGQSGGRLFPILLQILLCAGIAAAAQWIMGLVNNRIAYLTSARLRDRCFAHLQRLPISRLERDRAGDTISRVITDVEQISDGLLLALAQLFSGVLTIAVTIFFMIRIHLWIALFVVVASPVSFFVAKFIADRSFSYFRQQSELRGELTGCTEELLGNLKVIKAFGREQASKETFDGINARLGQASVQAIFYSSLPNPTTRFMYAVIYAGVTIAGCLLCAPAGGAALTVGKLTSFLAYTNQYTKPFNEITSLVTEFQNALASADRVYEFLDIAEEEADAEDAELLSCAAGDVEIEHVDFSYARGVPVLRDITATAHPGEHIALVGPTGCGKTTLISLLLRFYDADAGEIRVDGTEIRRLQRSSLRENIGMVLQETWLADGTVRENIAYGRPEAGEEEIIQAAKAAHAHSFIERLPQGYDTSLAEGGVELSSGQQQLLCIARVMLQLPALLILDEATSSIDTMTERRVQRAFREMMQGRTSFIVAHRLSTIREADRILVMREGRIVEQGTHRELLQSGGFYAELYNAQFGR